MFGSVTTGDRPVRPGHQDHLRPGQVGEFRPVLVLGEHRHAEHQRVHAGKHPPGRPQHPADVGDQRFSGQGQRKGAALGDDAVSGPVREEAEAREISYYIAKR
ncbi:MAG: hypothetical protein ABSA93_05180 [Streptosporangiaceae bacterium]